MTLEHIIIKGREFRGGSDEKMRRIWLRWEFVVAGRPPLPSPDSLFSFIKFPTLYIEFLVKQIWVNQFNNKTTRFSRAASVLSIFLYVFFFFFLGLAWIHSLWLKVYLYRIHYIYVKALESFYNTNTGFMRFFSISYISLQNV